MEEDKLNTEKVPIIEQCEGITDEDMEDLKALIQDHLDGSDQIEEDDYDSEEE